MKKNELKLRELMSLVFQTSIESITSDASPETIEKWDSLHHMQLIIAVEETFNVVFTDEQTVNLNNYNLIKEFLFNKGIDL